MTDECILNSLTVSWLTVRQENIFFEALRPVCNSTLNNEPQNQADTVTAESNTTGSTELLVITAVFQFLQYTGLTRS